MIWLFFFCEFFLVGIKSHCHWCIPLQSPDLSGTDWFSLSSLQLGLVVIQISNLPMLSLLLSHISYQDENEFPSFFIQASSSLYGALGGSLLAYRIADFLGELKSYTFFNCPYHFFDKDVNNYHLHAGRRIELVTAAALYIVGALVTGFAPNFVVLIIGRVLYGIGIGLVSICRYTHVFYFLFLEWPQVIAIKRT